MRQNCFVSEAHVAHVKMWKLNRLSTVFSEVNLHYKRRSFSLEHRLWREKVTTIVEHDYIIKSSPPSPLHWLLIKTHSNCM